MTMSNPHEPTILVTTTPAGEAVWAIWTSEGWIDQSEFKDCRTVSFESDGRHTQRLCAFLEAVGLDADAQWVVMADGSLVATQSIDHPLYDGQPGWVHEDFDEWSELTKERDAYRADAEAERHRNPYA